MAMDPQHPHRYSFPTKKTRPSTAKSCRKRTQFAMAMLVVLAMLLVTNHYAILLVKEEDHQATTMAHFVRHRDPPSIKKPPIVPRVDRHNRKELQERQDGESKDEFPVEIPIPPSSEALPNNDHSVDAPTKRLLLDEPESSRKQAGKDDKKSQAYFIKRGNQFYVTSRDALDLKERLPAGTYSIGVNPMSGEYFLQTIESFDIGGKIYGDTERQAERILQTFMARRGSTGVLLSGEKGSGKTFLAKFIAIKAAREQQIPTVVVNQPLFGERFNQFIQSIQQPTIFLFDEFEKIYAEQDPMARAREAEMEMFDESPRHNGRNKGMGNYNQDSMLTLLDGTYTAKMLFILTTNNKYKVSDHMRNRPGRIFYVIDFAGLPVDFIKEYCNDNLQDKAKISQVVAVAGLFEAFSFDMLQAMVEEMNRYNETPEQVLNYLNVRPEFTSGTRYMVKLVVDSVEIPQRNIHSGAHWFGNPLASVVVVHYQKPRNRKRPPVIGVEEAMKPEQQQQMMMAMEEEYEDSYGEIEFSTKHIDGMDPVTGTLFYWNEEKKARLTLIKNGILSGQSNGSMLHKLSQLGSVVASAGTEQ